MTERRCGTCRWWTQSRRTAPIIGTCGAVLPSWASRALATMMPVTFDDDGADCPVWAESPAVASSGDAGAEVAGSGEEGR